MSITNRRNFSKALAAVAALVSTVAVAAAPKVVYRSVNLSRAEREKLELAARTRSLLAEDYGRMLYLEGVADAAKGTLPRQPAAAARLTAAASSRSSAGISAISSTACGSIRSWPIRSGLPRARATIWKSSCGSRTGRARSG